jgi:hypothetical protein
MVTRDFPPCATAKPVDRTSALNAASKDRNIFRGMDFLPVHI